MRKSIIGAIVLLLISLSVQAVHADEASHLKAAEQLLELFDMQQVLSQTINEMLALEIQQDPQLALYEEEMKRFFSKYMSWEGLKEDFIKMYMEEFTEQELMDMLEFYKTPTGQKAVKKTPVLAAKGAQIGQKRVQENIDELVKMIEEKTQKLIEMEQKDKE